MVLVSVLKRWLLSPSASARGRSLIKHLQLRSVLAWILDSKVSAIFSSVVTGAPMLSQRGEGICRLHLSVAVEITATERVEVGSKRLHRKLVAQIGMLMGEV